jgi:hypothetical protein
MFMLFKCFKSMSQVGPSAEQFMSSVKFHLTLLLLIISKNVFVSVNPGLEIHERLIVYPSGKFSSIGDWQLPVKKHFIVLSS